MQALHQIQSFSTACASGCSHNVRLLNDLDLTGLTGFTPIGGAGGYSGKFYGMGHVLSNFNYWTDATGSSYDGFFSELNGALVNQVGGVPCLVVSLVLKTRITQTKISLALSFQSISWQTSINN